MPRNELCMGLYSIPKWLAVKGAIFPNWSIITGGRNTDLLKPIACNVNFDTEAGVQVGMSKWG